MNKVLLADDDADSRVLLEAELIALGFSVESAVNGKAALNLIRANVPDIIISDAMMADMDGFELCRTLKADPTLRSIPFIFYSATYTDARDEQLALSMGAARYIIKPIDMPHLMRIVKEELDAVSTEHPSIPSSTQDQRLDKRYSQMLARKLDQKVCELEAEREATRGHINHLQKIDIISRALTQFIQPEERIRHLLEEILLMFQVDRAWLLYPCDPNSPTFTIPMAATTAEYPGAETEGDQPIEGPIIDLMREVLETEQPVAYEPGHLVLESELLQHFQVKSQIIIAIRPKDGKAWQFGLHQCQSERQWTNYEKKLFKDISVRMSDVLASYLYAKDLTASEERNRILVENAPEAITVLDVETACFIDANGNALSLFGKTREQLLDIGIADVSAPVQPNGSASVKLASEYIDATLRGENPVFEWVLHGQDGESLYTEVRLSELPSLEHRLIRASIIDTTEKKRLLETTRQQEIQLIQANKMSALGTLVAGVAHELNNPNHLISLNTELLEHISKDLVAFIDEQTLDDKSRLLGGLPFAEAKTALPGLIDDIGHASTRIQKIIDNLRDFSRPASGNFTPIDVNQSIFVSLNLLGHILTNTPLKLELGEALPKINGNEQALQQIVTNLVTNALEALPKQNGNIHITSTLSEDMQSILVKVKDNGMGITRENLERISEPFFTTKRNSGGTGLGLAICYSLVKEHGGELDYTSTPGDGTTAILRLPIIQ